MKKHETVVRVDRGMRYARSYCQSRPLSRGSFEDTATEGLRRKKIDRALLVVAIERTRERLSTVHRTVDVAQTQWDSDRRWNAVLGCYTVKVSPLCLAEKNLTRNGYIVGDLFQ